MTRALLLVLLLAVPAGPARGAAQEAPQDSLSVHLLTMDQGDEVWERFGHNAILIRNETTGEALTWNWGLFDFRDADFLPRFLRGTMYYSMGPAELEPFLRSYADANRTVYSNEVNLTQEQARELDEFVRWNYRPENRRYTYDYYRDNCSTRVRDALDDVLDGAIRQAFVGAQTPRTYRWHSRRLVQGTLWVDQGLSFLLGTRGDVPITEWEAMFVPMRMMELLEGMEIEDAAGVPRPLLGPREVLYAASRPPAPATPPAFSFAWLWAGLALGGAAAGLGWGARTGRGTARIGLGLMGGAWGLFAGSLGLLLVLAWFTDHEFIHWNVNVLYASPLALALGAVALPASLRRSWWGGSAGLIVRGLGILVAALSLIAGLLQLTGIVQQGNIEVVALALPLNVGLAAALLVSRAGEPGERPRLDASGASG